MSVSRAGRPGKRSPQATAALSASSELLPVGGSQPRSPGWGLGDMLLLLLLQAELS